MIIKKLNGLSGNDVSGEAVFIEAVGVLRICGGEVLEAVTHTTLCSSGVIAGLVGGEVKANVHGLGECVVVDCDVPLASVTCGVALSLHGLG